ncbi:putative Antibiotic biosynthesis monooxygenase [Mycena venus]|uniref:Putative Antibiotic biosynthesis monooxygenase n=1 Tax=Mycena venus TaxID=2733690 RepID=A0A8H6WYD7_9AGAR|nr:putative Antibiotic biosynthesis monooxygenase [Mycena venus]
MVYTVIVHLWTAPGKEEEMKAVIKEASAIFLKDEGTINLFSMQDSKDPTAWTFVERYEGEHIHKLHMENPYFKKFMAAIGPLVDPARKEQISTHNEL